MTSYYLAASFARNAEMRVRRDELLAAIPGSKVTSRWIDLHPDIVGSAVGLTRVLDTEPEHVWRFAQHDLEDVVKADVFIAVTGAGTSGGRHVEYGYALALSKRLVVVGPRENVFYTHPSVERFTDWQTFLLEENRR